MDQLAASAQNAATIRRRTFRPTVAIAIGLVVLYFAGLTVVTSSEGRDAYGIAVVLGVINIGGVVLAIAIATSRWRRRRPLGESVVGLALLGLQLAVLPGPISYLGAQLGGPDWYGFDGIVIGVLGIAWALVTWRAVAAYVRDVRENQY